jgi:hypothetical protein
MRSAWRVPRLLPAANSKGLPVSQLLVPCTLTLAPAPPSTDPSTPRALQDLLKQLLMYYIVPTGAFKIADLKGKQFRTSMDTPPCTGGLLAVADDGKVVGQRYSAALAAADVQACSSIMHFIDHLVMPCCGTLEDILAGGCRGGGGG